MIVAILKGIGIGIGIIACLASIALAMIAANAIIAGFCYIVVKIEEIIKKK